MTNGHKFRKPRNKVIGVAEMLIEVTVDQDNQARDELLTRVHRAEKTPTE